MDFRKRKFPENVRPYGNLLWGNFSPTPKIVKLSCNQQVSAGNSIGNEAHLMMTILKNKIKINPEEEERSKCILQEFLLVIIKKMKEMDELFNSLFQRFYYTGSFYDGLRISHATEFDINLVLKLPFPNTIRKIEYLMVQSFAKYKLLNENWPLEKKTICELVRKQFFKDNYLSASEVKKWIQSIIDKILYYKMLKINNVNQILVSSSGPAKTIKLETSFGYCIDIDLVPVIEFTGEWPSGASKTAVKKFKVPEHDQFWFLVPKEYGGKQPLSAQECDRCWRMHFSEIEKNILHSKGFVKPIIKILKLLRDKQGWTILASYYLKTVVMWMVLDNPEEIYWTADKSWERLIMALKKLEEFVRMKNIPYLFYPHYNLIEKISDAQVFNIINRLNRIISDISLSHNNIMNFI